MPLLGQAAARPLSRHCRHCSRRSRLSPGSRQTRVRVAGRGRHWASLVALKSALRRRGRRRMRSSARAFASIHQRAVMLLGGTTPAIAAATAGRCSARRQMRASLPHAVRLPRHASSRRFDQRGRAQCMLQTSSGASSSALSPKDEARTARLKKLFDGLPGASDAAGGAGSAATYEARGSATHSNVWAEKSSLYNSLVPRVPHNCAHLVVGVDLTADCRRAGPAASGSRLGGAQERQDRCVTVRAPLSSAGAHSLPA